MESFLPIYISIFVIMMVTALQRQTIIRRIVKRRVKRGVNKMDNILDKCVGKRCIVSTGSMGVRVDGVVKQVTEKWIEIECGKRTEIISLDFIQNIRIKNSEKTY